MGKTQSYYGKSMSINFPDFPHTMGFVAFSRNAGNLWGNPCISHMMTLVSLVALRQKHFLKSCDLFS